MNTLNKVALVALLPACLLQAEAAEKPNILIILADDTGFSDIGSYGGEISTPNVDALARSGVKFSNFHVSATCSPTRAMLMTGVDNHINGLGNMRIIMADNQFGQPGYEGELNDRVETFASILQRSGYGTYMAGKWHLGMSAGSLPGRRGFDKSVALMETGADNWEAKPYLPHNKKVHYYEGLEQIDLPDDFYSSDFYARKLIGYLQEHDKEQPFLAYLAFQASHYPHQAPRAITEKYLARYEGGWESIKSARYERLVQLGLMPPGLEPLALPTIEDWQALSAEQKRYRSKQMAVYAAMVERMDYNIGLLVDYLKAAGLFDNTVIFFLSDNGADNNEMDKVYPEYIRSHFDTSYERLGEKGSYSNYGPSWANVSATPLSWYKGSASEGGMRAPLIVHYPARVRQGVKTDALSYVTDIAATILDFAGLSGTGSKAAPPISGRSLRHVLEGSSKAVYSQDDIIGYELAGSAAVFKGKYKLVRNSPPFGDRSWKLFDIEADPVERFDLSESHPGLLREMLAAYEAYARRVGLVEVPADYDAIKQLTKNLKRMRDAPH